MSDDQDGCEWVSFFLYRPTRVVPDQQPLNGCVCVCVCVSNALNMLVSGEKPGFQALSKGLIVLLCTGSSGK